MLHSARLERLPYGAFELKATYQRNILFGTATAVLLVVATLLGFQVWKWITLDEVVPVAPPVRIRTVSELGPPPTVISRPVEVRVQSAGAAAPRVGIPVPVPDETVIDQDVTIATREEISRIVEPSVGVTVGDSIIIAPEAVEYIPAPDEFVPMEIYPEMIYSVQPEYPRLAIAAGLTGQVIVRALVDTDGSVRKAEVDISSGIATLDDAAVLAAYKYKYKPGIQNGRAVLCWVKYKVGFSFTQ